MNFIALFVYYVCSSMYVVVVLDIYNVHLSKKYNPPSLFFSLVAIWPLTVQVWFPVKNFSC